MIKSSTNNIMNKTILFSVHIGSTIFFSFKEKKNGSKHPLSSHYNAEVEVDFGSYQQRGLGSNTNVIAYPNTIVIIHALIMPMLNSIRKICPAPILQISI